MSRLRDEPRAPEIALDLRRAFGSDARTMRSLRIGDRAPDFVLPRAGGGSFDSRSLRGKRWLFGFHRYAT